MKQSLRFNWQCPWLTLKNILNIILKPFFSPVTHFKQASSSCLHLSRISVTAVVSLAILPRTVTFRRMVSITKYSTSSVPWAEICGWRGVHNSLETSCVCPSLEACYISRYQGFIVLFGMFFLLWKPAITAVEVATLRRTARSPRGRGSSAATTAANPATWLGTATTQTSRSAILVESLDTFKKTAPKWNAIGKNSQESCKM